LPYDWSTALPEVPWTRELPGVFSLHDDSCPVQFGGRCTCGPLGYFATVVDPVTSSHLVSPIFGAVGDAQAWQFAQHPYMTAFAQQPNQTAFAQQPNQTPFAQQANQTPFAPQPNATPPEPPQWPGEQKGDVPEAPSGASRGRDLGAVIEEFLEAAQEGRFLDENGQAYSRESIRDLRGALSYADSELGTLEIQDIRRRNVQALVDQLRAAGLSSGRVVAVAAALQVVYSYAIKQGLVDHSPVVELVLPESDNGNSPHAPDQYTHSMTISQGPAVPPVHPAPDTLRSQSAFPPAPAYPTPPPGYPTPTGFAPSGYQAPLGTPIMPATPPAYTGFSTVPEYAPQTLATPTGQVPALATRVLGRPPGVSETADYDSTQQERFLWWTVRIVVIVFVLIALVLAAESI
jgi:hypothetical protein